MQYKFKETALDHKVSFRFDGWFRVRKNNMNQTSVLWLKNNRMMFDDGIYNSKTPILIFLN